MENMMKTKICLGFKILFCFGIYFGTSEAAFAAKKSKKRIELARDTKKITSKDTPVPSDISEDNREDKKYLITATPLGIGLGFITGITGGYYLNPHTIVGGRIENHSLDLKIYGYEFFSAQTKSAGGFVKYFMGNSFYIDAGLSANITEFTVKNIGYTSEKGFYEYRQHEKWQHGGLDLAIGNQWQWEHFTLGTDWIGIYQPLTQKQVEYENTAVGDDVQNIKLGVNHARILAFYLGMSF
jgi:hypothetical protein